MKFDSPVHVTRSFLPPIDEYKSYIDKIWENGQLTNRGPLLQQFEQETKDFLKVENFQFVTNGTLALQLAINGLGITEGEIITTPFSYVATTSAILWQRCKPVFVDIDPKTLNINPNNIEAAITKDTKAILAVHVFGNACDIDRIQEIADKHNLRVIYDGAHSFGARYKGKSLLDYGDVSIVSFHATKLFHTIEGGGIISRNKKIHDQIDLEKRFGHNQDDHVTLGINAKANEFQAAMGLANLKYIDDIIKSRKGYSQLYDKLLGDGVIKIKTPDQENYNYAYYPVLFKSNEALTRVLTKLSASNVFPRRYFYPSLNSLSYIEQKQVCSVSEDIAERIVCLPLYSDMNEEVVTVVAGVINNET